MKNKIYLISLIALPFLIACDMPESVDDEFFDDLEKFNLEQYNPSEALATLNEIGHSETGYEISLVFRYYESRNELVDKEIVKTETDQVTRYTIGQMGDVIWAYADVTINDSTTKYGIGYDEEGNVYKYINSSWSLVIEEDIESVVDYYAEAINEMTIPNSSLEQLKLYGEGPENVTIAGRRCAKYTISADAIQAAGTSSFTFDCDTGLLFAYSTTVTLSDATSSLTTTTSLNATGFSIAPIVPKFPK